MCGRQRVGIVDGEEVRERGGGGSWGVVLWWGVREWVFARWCGRQRAWSRSCESMLRVSGVEFAACALDG